MSPVYYLEIPKFVSWKLKNSTKVISYAHHMQLREISNIKTKEMNLRWSKITLGKRKAMDLNFDVQKPKIVTRDNIDQSNLNLKSLNTKKSKSWNVPSLCVKNTRND